MHCFEIRAVAESFKNVTAGHVTSTWSKLMKLAVTFDREKTKQDEKIVELYL